MISYSSVRSLYNNSALNPAARTASTTFSADTSAFTVNNLSGDDKSILHCSGVKNVFSCSAILATQPAHLAEVFTCIISLYFLIILYRNLKLLSITDTELNAIAALAHIGDNNIPTG